MSHRDVLRELRIMRHILYQWYRDNSRQSPVNEEVFESLTDDELRRR